MEIYVGNLEFEVLTTEVYTEENGIIYVEVEATDGDFIYILRYSLTGMMPEIIEPTYPYFKDDRDDEFEEEFDDEDDEE